MLVAARRSARQLAEIQVATVFPGVAFAPFVAASEFVGIAGKTAQNLRFAKAYPLPVTKRGSRLLVPIAALVDFVETDLRAAGYPDDEELAIASLKSIVHAPKRPRGRPRKVAVANCIEATREEL